MLHVIFEKSFLDTFCCYQLSTFTQIFHRSQLLLIQCKRKSLIFELPFSQLATSKSWHFSDQHCVFVTFLVLKKGLSNAGVELTLIWAILRTQRQSQAGQADEEQKETECPSGVKQLFMARGCSESHTNHPQFTRPHKIREYINEEIHRAVWLLCWGYHTIY